VQILSVRFTLPYLYNTIKNMTFRSVPDSLSVGQREACWCKAKQQGRCNLDRGCLSLRQNAFGHRRRIGEVRVHCDTVLPAWIPLALLNSACNLARDVLKAVKLEIEGD
jgi:hypothetical protein